MSAVLFGLAVPLGTPAKDGTVLHLPDRGPVRTSAVLLLGHHAHLRVADGVTFHRVGRAVYFEAELPGTELARDCAKLVDWGFVPNCSIGARIAADGGIEQVAEVSLVSAPAFESCWVTYCPAQRNHVWGMADYVTKGRSVRPREQLDQHMGRWAPERERLMRLIELSAECGNRG